VEKNQITSKTQNCHPPSLLQNNNLAIIPQENSELLASHLANTFKPHNISPDTPHLLRVEEFISSSLPMAPPASPTSPGEVLSVIKKLKKNKLPGHDGINNSTAKNYHQKPLSFSHIFLMLFSVCPISQTPGNQP